MIKFKLIIKMKKVTSFYKMKKKAWKDKKVQALTKYCLILMNVCKSNQQNYFLLNSLSIIKAFMILKY